MTHLFKTTAIAALALTTALPAFATTYDVSTMTCSEYNELSAVDKDAVALAAVTELNDNAAATIAPNNGEETATAPLVGEEATDSTAAPTSTIAPNNGEATATEGAPIADDQTSFEAEIELLNLTCERSIDATVMEAAAGSEGTR